MGFDKKKELDNVSLKERGNKFMGTEDIPAQVNRH